MIKALEKYYSFTRKINMWAGKVSLWLVIPMALLVAFEVTMRYVFNKPTIWSWDVCVQLLAVVGALGGGYGLIYKSHVAVDVMVQGMSKRKRAILDTLTDLVTVISLVFLTWYLAKAAYNSVRTLELYVTVFRPPIYPLRVVITLGSLFLLLQSISNLLKNLTISLGLVRPETGDKP